MLPRDCAALSFDEAPELWARLAWESDLWIFAYGSLMWEPGFPYCEAVPALLRGHHRSFCVYSRSHRGTAARPGLVLGLDRGGQCKGIAYRVPAIDVPAALAYLWDREMRTRIYRLDEVELEFGLRRVSALAFIVDRAHRDYAGDLPIDEQARLIRQGHGKNGSAASYLDSTMRELERLGVIDQSLKRLEGAVRSGAAPRSAIRRRAA